MSRVRSAERWHGWWHWLRFIDTSIDHIPDPLLEKRESSRWRHSSFEFSNTTSLSLSFLYRYNGEEFLFFFLFSCFTEPWQHTRDHRPRHAVYTKKEKKRKKSLKETGEMTFHFERETGRERIFARLFESPAAKRRHRPRALRVICQRECALQSIYITRTRHTHTSGEKRRNFFQISFFSFLLFYIPRVHFDWSQQPISSRFLGP